MKYLSLIPILAIVLISACAKSSNEGVGGASITLSFPTGGETFNQGDKITIQYDSSNVDHYQIWFTTNPDFACDSAGWNLIKNHPYYNRTFEYTLPYQSTTTARIRIEGHSAIHETLTFVCSDVFTIQA